MLWFYPTLNHKDNKKEKSILLFRGDDKVHDPAVLESIVSAAVWCSKKVFFMSIRLPKTAPSSTMHKQDCCCESGYSYFVALFSTVIKKINPSTSPSISLKYVGVFQQHFTK